MSEDPTSPVPAANDERSDLTALKDLLLAREQQAIRQINNDLDDTELQTTRVKDVLPDALQRSYGDSREALAAALDQPVFEAMKGSIQRDPGFFAEVLYPVMGPAIRRSIAQALKGLVQQINQTLEHSLTLKGMRWRIEAARTGVPFAEVVLRNTLRYRVEEVFLIQTGSGLLIQHLGRSAEDDKDADATSAMLTAIRDFARDTFDRDGDEDSRLETIDAGDHTLWLIHGPRAYLACAIRGVAPIGLRDELSRVLEGIHRVHANLLQSFAGDQTQAAPLRPLLEPCLQTELAEPETRKKPWPAILLGIALLGALAWWVYGLYQHNQDSKASFEHRRAAVDSLKTARGIVITEWQIGPDGVRVAGLHDPLTPAPQGLLERAGLAPEEIQTDFRAFQSTAPEAAIRRARQRLSPPDSVRLVLDDMQTLHATGMATIEWRERARLVATTVPGVAAYDDGALTDPDRLLLERARTLTEPPDSVEIRVHDGVATFSGSAPQDWIERVDARLADLTELKAVALGDLEADESRELDAVIGHVGRIRVNFIAGSELDETQRERVDHAAALIQRAQDLARRIGQRLGLRIIGRTDGSGSPKQNFYVARQRAEMIATMLRENRDDMPPMTLDTRMRHEYEPEEPDSLLRRAEFELRRLND